MVRHRRVLVLDDLSTLRAALNAVAPQPYGLEMVDGSNGAASSSSGDEVRRADLIVIDIDSPDAGSVAVEFAELKQRHEGSPVLVLTTHAEDEYVDAALQAGADGYALKDDSPLDLLAAIHSLLAGKSYISPTLCRRIVMQYLRSRTGANARPSDVLTRREREVIGLIANGCRTREIALLLSVSHKTIEKHRASLMRKLSLRSASAVTAYAISHGYVHGDKNK